MSATSHASSRNAPTLAGPAGEHLATNRHDGEATPFSRTPSSTRLAAPGESPGLLLGRWEDGSELRSAPMHPVVVIGPTGSGKTTQVAASMVIDWPGTVIVVGVRSDLIAATIDRRRDVGPVWVVDTAAAPGSGYPPAGFELVACCRDLDTAHDIAEALVSAGHGDGLLDSGFWYSLSVPLIACALYAASATGLRFSDVHAMVLADPALRLRQLLQALDDRRALALLDTFSQREERIRSSVIATVNQVLGVFHRPAAMAAVCGDDFTISDLTTSGQPCTLYVPLPAADLGRNSPVVAALLSLVTARAQATTVQEGPTRSVLLLVDDAAYVDAITRNGLAWTATARAAGIQVVTLWQDVAQLRTRFGPEAATLINGADAVIVMDPGSDPDTHDYLTRALATCRAPLNGSEAADLIGRIPDEGHLVLQDRQAHLARLPAWWQQT